MSINGSVASFLPFTINGLTDASFSNSNLGVATATSLTLTSATPLKLARFDLDKNLVSASVDESEVAVLTSNVFDGTQTMKPGHTTNINNVFQTTIVANPPYDKSSFTTSGISGYTAPLGTITGPVAGEYSISQTADDRSVMKLDSFVPEAGRKYVYTFTMRIIDAPEAYVSVEQGGVQRSNTIIQIGSTDETISDTFTFDPAGSTLVFKIYTGSLDPWTATWSSFSLGYYEASINAPINALTITNLATEVLTFPSNNSNSESWSVYAISTMNNPSTLGGIIFQEATKGVGAYITDGVVGAKSFQFNTLSGNAGKVVVTNADQVMSTSINAGQLDYITGLTSQAGGVGQTNTWTDVNTFNTLTNVAALRITSSVVNADYTLSVNQFDQLEFTNLSNGSIFKTNGSDLFVTGDITCGALGATDVAASGSFYVAKGSPAEWRTTLGASDEYEILDNAGLMRLRLSKTTGLTVSTMNITQVPSATPSLALGLNGGGSVVSFAVPTATNILPLDNTFTGINTFTNDVSLGVSTVVVNQQSIATSILQTAGISSQALGGTAVISGSYLLTPTPTTFAYASVYSPTQTFLANAKFNYLFTGFTAGIFGVSLTVYQANVANTGFIAISSTVPVVVGTFSGIFTPNINASYLGQVYFTFSGINSKTVGWTTFTYQRGMETVNGNVAVNGDTTAVGNLTINNGTNAVIRKNGDTAGNFCQILGGTTTNSPNIDFHSGGTRRMYVGYCNATDTFITAENGVNLNLGTQATTRMIINTAGNVGIGRNDPGFKLDVNGAMRVKNDANGNDSKTIYGPNASWSAFLVVGSGTDSSGPATAQCISTNGNLHLDAGNGLDMYYGYYPFSRGTPNVHRWYGGNYNFDGLPQNGSSFSHVGVYDGATLKRSQAVNRLVYFNNNVAWGGGVNMTYAFYLYNTSCSVQIWGKCSGYYSGAGMMQTTIRIYCQNTGVYTYYPFNSFVNNGYNHFTVPLNYSIASGILSGAGSWYDIYVYSTSGWITDGNDQLTIGLTILPISNF